jgi:uncharacterized cupin superfamily protein
VQHLTHWDEVEPRRREVGHLGGTWRDLGTAAGTRGVGVQRIDVDPGRWSTPAHVEGAAEEIFYVLAGFVSSTSPRARPTRSAPAPTA